jgi:hypothetical protein
MFVPLACAKTVSPHAERLGYFCDGYLACRAQFQQTARSVVAVLPPAQRDRAEIGQWVVPSRIDSDLTIDYLYLPPKESAENLLIMSSGTHGVEGLAGSAFQTLLMKEILPGLDRSRLGILLIHCINPYGMKYVRRVSENNVDLNRNFDVDRELFGIQNEGYLKLNPLLNPTTQVKESFLSEAAFYFSAAKLLLREPLATLRQATLGGQYQFERGLYFGGFDFEPQKALLEKPILEKTRPYRNILVLDLHTGYGRRGVLHLFPSAYRDPRVEAATQKVFAGFKIEDPHSPEFYDNHGDFSTYVSKLMLAQNKLAVPMTLEYGTYDNTGSIRGAESLRRMIRENQWHWYGATGEKAAKTVRGDFIELYYPNSAQWRQMVIDLSAQRFPTFLSAFSRLGAPATR